MFLQNIFHQNLDDVGDVTLYISSSLSMLCKILQGTSTEENHENPELELNFLGSFWIFNLFLLCCIPSCCYHLTPDWSFALHRGFALCAHQLSATVIAV